MTQVQAIIKQRGEAYGDYATQSAIARKFKAEIEKHTHKMTDIQREALDMIAVKISRLVNGDPSHRDGWVDIIGYATLALGEIDRAVKVSDEQEKKLKAAAVQAAQQIGEAGIAV